MLDLLVGRISIFRLMIADHCLVKIAKDETFPRLAQIVGLCERSAALLNQPNRNYNHRNCADDEAGTAEYLVECLSVVSIESPKCKFRWWRRALRFRLLLCVCLFAT